MRRALFRSQPASKCSKRKRPLASGERSRIPPPAHWRQVSRAPLSAEVPPEPASPTCTQRCPEKSCTSREVKPRPLAKPAGPGSCGQAWPLLYPNSNKPPLETRAVLFAKGWLQSPRLPRPLRTVKSQVAVVWSTALLIYHHPQALDRLHWELKPSLSERPRQPCCIAKPWLQGPGRRPFWICLFSSPFSLLHPLISPLLEHSRFYFQSTDFRTYGSSKKPLEGFAIHRCSSPLELGHAEEVGEHWSQSLAPRVLSSASSSVTLGKSCTSGVFQV